MQILQQQRLVVLGTGGTIAGTAASATDHVGYNAAQLGVQQLLGGIAAPAGLAVEAEQVAQVDSSDMTTAVWQRLVQRVAHHLTRPEVKGVVVTHGTDTLEETAYLLHRVLAPTKPVVMTGAMRPATAIGTDGPANLNDALQLAAAEHARGVLVVFAGEVWAGHEVRKQHPYKLSPFDAGDAGPVAKLEQGGLRMLRDWPQGIAFGQAVLAAPTEQWPWVPVLASHGGIDERQVTALLAAGARALVVAGTGNGSIHEALLPALRQAAANGVPVWLTSRCAAGVLVGEGFEFHTRTGLSPWALRVEAMLQLMALTSSSS
jgi:L-asparaginase